MKASGLHGKLQAWFYYSIKNSTFYGRRITPQCASNPCIRRQVVFTGIEGSIVNADDLSDAEEDSNIKDGITPQSGELAVPELTEASNNIVNNILSMCFVQYMLEKI